MLIPPQGCQCHSNLAACKCIVLQWNSTASQYSAYRYAEVRPANDSLYRCFTSMHLIAPCALYCQIPNSTA